jgi:hypothetical protein
MEKALNERTETIKNQYNFQFKSVSSIAIAIDAGTIKSRHFLEIVLLAPAFRIRPFLYDSVEETCLAARDYERASPIRSKI